MKKTNKKSKITRKFKNFIILLISLLSIALIFSFLHYSSNSLTKSEKIMTPDKSYTFVRNKQIIELENEDDFGKIINSQSTLILFYAKWCPFSKELDTRILDIQQKSNFQILYIDVDRFPELVKRFNIMSTPHLIRYVKNEETLGLPGSLPTEDVLYFLKHNDLPEVQSTEKSSKMK